MSLILNKLQLATTIARCNFIPKVIPAKFFTSNQQNNEETSSSETKTKRKVQIVPVEASVKYLQSKAYKNNYGDDPVWKNYRRNYKGHFQPRKTRKLCIRNNYISTGSPCPICRDEYLVVDYRNTKLLKQFISEHNGQILHYNVTGVCQKVYTDLLIAIMKAKDCGLIVHDVPFRYYDYSDWKN